MGKFLLILILSLLFIKISICQISNDNNLNKFSIKYIKACHGNCNISTDDSCKRFNDIILENIVVFKKNNNYYKNSNLLNKEAYNYIDTFLTKNFYFFIDFDKEIKANYNAQFIPPLPTCYDYEIYEIFFKGRLIKLKVINKNSSELGYILRENEIDMIERLKKIVK